LKARTSDADSKIEKAPGDNGNTGPDGATFGKDGEEDATVKPPQSESDLKADATMVDTVAAGAWKPGFTKISIPKTHSSTGAWSVANEDTLNCEPVGVDDGGRSPDGGTKTASVVVTTAGDGADKCGMPPGADANISIEAMSEDLTTGTVGNDNGTTVGTVKPVSDDGRSSGVANVGTADNVNGGLMSRMAAGTNTNCENFDAPAIAKGGGTNDDVRVAKAANVAEDDGVEAADTVTAGIEDGVTFIGNGAIGVGLKFVPLSGCEAGREANKKHTPSVTVKAPSHGNIDDETPNGANKLGNAGAKDGAPPCRYSYWCRCHQRGW